MLKTKIIATLGPTSCEPGVVGQLLDAGVDVFRLNFSHGAHSDHGAALKAVRNACRDKDAVAAVMVDLCGPKIRVDPLEHGGFELAVGAILWIVRDHVVGTPERISTNRPELVRELKVGHRVLIDDGNVRLRVQGVAADSLECVCEVGGRISDRKGMNLPDSDLAMSAITEKDIADIAWAVEHEADYIAVSFVRSAADLTAVRERLPIDRDAWRIVAKIETPQAVANIDSIIEASDIVLIARGDLGVEMDLAEVPLIQKRIARLCRTAGKPVIIATQMLQTMVDNPTPTRAEVSDVANAMLDHADCVMLSAETAVGKYPVETVRMITRIGDETEAYLGGLPQGPDVLSPAMRRVTTAVSHGANLLARELKAAAVAVWTETGNTARLLSKHRLDSVVIGLSPDEYVCRRMAMYYGVQPVRLGRSPSTEVMLAEVDAMVQARGYAKSGDLVVVVAGTHLDEPGATNALFIHLVRGPSS